MTTGPPSAGAALASAMAVVELVAGVHLDDVGAEAARVGGEVDGQDVAVEPAARRCVGGRRVPNRCEPRPSESEPMEWKPWFCTSTTMTLTRSWTAVTSSVGIMR